MCDALNNLPSIGQMFKLVVVLLFAVVAIGLILAIVKMLTPFLIMVALIAGGIYLFNNGMPSKQKR